MVGASPLLGGQIVVEVMSLLTLRRFGEISTKNSVRYLEVRESLEVMVTGIRTPVALQVECQQSNLTKNLQSED